MRLVYDYQASTTRPLKIKAIQRIYSRLGYTKTNVYKDCVIR